LPKEWSQAYFSDQQIGELSESGEAAGFEILPQTETTVLVEMVREASMNRGEYMQRSYPAKAEHRTLHL